MEIVDFPSTDDASPRTSRDKPSLLPSPRYAIIIYFEGTARGGEKLFRCVLPSIFPARRKINTADNEGIVGTTRQYRRHFNFRWSLSFSLSFSVFLLFLENFRRRVEIMGIESTRDGCSLRGANGNNGDNGANKRRGETSTRVPF